MMDRLQRYDEYVEGGFFEDEDGPYCYYDEAEKIISLLQSELDEYKAKELGFIATMYELNKQLENIRAEVEEETIGNIIGIIYMEKQLRKCFPDEYWDGVKDSISVIENMPRKYQPVGMESVSDSTNEQDKE